MMFAGIGMSNNTPPAAPGGAKMSSPSHHYPLKKGQARIGQLHESASLNIFASIPSYGMRDSAHNGIPRSERITPEPVCRIERRSGPPDLFGMSWPVYHPVCEMPPQPPPPGR